MQSKKNYKNILFRNNKTTLNGNTRLVKTIVTYNNNNGNTIKKRAPRATEERGQNDVVKKKGCLKFKEREKKATYILKLK